MGCNYLTLKIKILKIMIFDKNGESNNFLDESHENFYQSNFMKLIKNMVLSLKKYIPPTDKEKKVLNHENQRKTKLVEVGYFTRKNNYKIISNQLYKKYFVNNSIGDPYLMCKHVAFPLLLRRFKNKPKVTHGTSEKKSILMRKILPTWFRYIKNTYQDDIISKIFSKKKKRNKKITNEVFPKK